MDRFLHFQFNDIGFNIYADENILKSLNCFWCLTMDVRYDSSFENDWSIKIVLMNEISDSTFVDYDGKTIVYYISKVSPINRINSFIREFITKITLARGYIWLHASACNILGKGCIIMGPKGNGKTTHLLNAYFNFGAEVIGNDQIPVRINNGHIVAYRWRPDIKFSPRTIHLVGGNSIAIQDNQVDRFLWMPDPKQYSVIDFEDLSFRRKQKIKSFHYTPIRMSAQREFQISKLIFLDEQSSPTWCELSFEQASWYLHHALGADKENLTPCKLQNWNKQVPYWNERISIERLDTDAEFIADQTINTMLEDLKIFRLYNRVDLDNSNIGSIIES